MIHNQNYPSFVGEVVFEVLDIVARRNHLRTAKFNLIYDCSAAKEIFEYNDSMYQLNVDHKNSKAMSFLLFIV